MSNIPSPLKNEDNQVVVGFGKWFNGAARGHHAINALIIFSIIFSILIICVLLIWRLT